MHALAERLGDTVDISPVYYTANTLTDKQTHTYRRFNVYSSADLHVFAL